MASTSQLSTCQSKNELPNIASHEKHESCPSPSGKLSSQRLCLSVFDCFAFFSSLFVVRPTNSLSSTPLTSCKHTNVFEEVAPSPHISGTSVMPMKKPPYDVFINHRGVDAKETLANLLYNTSIGMGFRIFLDSQELEAGEFLLTALEAAMNSAKLHIATISENYAQSPWCLAELCFILRTATKIVPVFYTVQPEDVRHGRGVFAEAFARHEDKGRYSNEKLQEWKNALRRVSYYVGHIINNKDDERKLLKNIVNCAMRVKSKEASFINVSRPRVIKILKKVIWIKVIVMKHNQYLWTKAYRDKYRKSPNTPLGTSKQSQNTQIVFKAHVK